MLNQEFVAERPNQVWMSDITYVPTGEGWMYLANVMDLYSRKIVGWRIEERMTKGLVIQALDTAVYRQNPVEHLLHQLDRGSQYASHDHQARLRSTGEHNFDQQQRLCGWG